MKAPDVKLLLSFLFMLNISCSFLGDTPARKLVGTYQIISGPYQGDVWLFDDYYRTFGDSLHIYSAEGQLKWREFCSFDMLDVNPSAWTDPHIFNEWVPASGLANNPYLPQVYLSGKMKIEKERIFFRADHYDFEIEAVQIYNFQLPDPGRIRIAE